MANILIIDDDEGFRMTLEQFLVASGHFVTSADNGFNAAKLYRESPTDLVLTDLMMPHGGLKVISVLRSQYPELRVIAMSGASNHRLDYAVALGANRTLAKPFTPEQLGVAISETLAADGRKRLEARCTGAAAHGVP
jgi:CheY-like chemotaxis protein